MPRPKDTYANTETVAYTTSAVHVSEYFGFDRRNLTFPLPCFPVFISRGDWCKTGALFATDSDALVLWRGEQLRLLGMRGGGGRRRGDHLPHVQNRAVRCQLGPAGGGAVVLGSYSCFGDCVSLARAGGLAVDGNAGAGSGDVVVPVQGGEIMFLRAYGLHLSLSTPMSTCPFVGLL